MTKTNFLLINKLIKNFNIRKGSNIYLGVDILMLAKIVNLKSKDLKNFANLFINYMLSKIGKNGTIVVPVFNLDCVPQKKFNRKTSKGQSGMFGNLLLKKNYHLRTKHPMYSFLVFGKKSNKYLKINNSNATGNNSLWKNFNDDNFQLVTLGHHYVRSLTHVHYLENLVGVDYRFVKHFDVNYSDINGKKFKSNFSFYARELDMCEFSSITKKCDMLFFKKKIAKFFYLDGLICFKLNLKNASKVIIKSLKAKSEKLVSYIRIGEFEKNKNVLCNENGMLYDLEKKYLLKKKMIYKI